MKLVFALPIIAVVAALTSDWLAAAETKTTVKKAPMATNAWGEAPTPHQVSSGKPASVAHGQAIFLDHCAICHGLHGKGDGPRSAFFVPGQQYIADLSNADFVNGRDAQLLESIREGLRRFPEPSYVMPQFKYILSDEEIRSALAYIKTLPVKSKK